MKKQFIVSVAVVGGLLLNGALRAEEVQTQDSWRAKYEQLAKEADRDKELLGIWKNHVKEVTRERDDAYQQIDTLKTSDTRNVVSSQSRPLKKGAIEVQPMATAPMIDRGAYQELERNFKIQEKRFNEIMKERNASDEEIRQLRSTIKSLETQLESKAEAPAPVVDDRVQSLESENRLLQVKSEKLKLLEQELKETQNYYTGVTGKLENEKKTLSAEKESLLKDQAVSQKKIEGLSAQVTQLQQDLIQNQKEQEANASARVRLEKDLKQSHDKEKSLSANINQLEGRVETLSKVAAENESLETALQSLRAAHEKSLRTIERLQSAFQSQSEAIKVLGKSFDQSYAVALQNQDAESD